MDSRNFTIGVLSTTAAVFLSALVIINSRPDPALASGMTAAGGEYVLTVGLDASADEELVYVIDSVAERLIVYRFDAVRQEIRIAQGIELSDLREAAGKADQAGKTPKKGRPGWRRP